MAQVKPDIVFYQSGVDVLAGDRLGKLALTKAGCKQRDKTVVATCRSHDVPLVVTMGGGYAPRLAHVVDAHCNTYRTVIEAYS